jgi:hypothetical protein
VLSYSRKPHVCRVFFTVDHGGHDAALARERSRFLAAIWRVFNEYELAGVASRKPALRRQLGALLYVS